MKPSVPVLMSTLGELIQAEVGPALGDSYLGQQMLRSVGLLKAAAEEFDRAAARRVEENRALRGLFADWAGVITDERLAGAMREAAAGRDDDLRVSALERSNQALRALLIELHAWSEQPGLPEAAALNAAVWAELAEGARRRRLSI